MGENIELDELSEFIFNDYNDKAVVQFDFKNDGNEYFDDDESLFQALVTLLHLGFKKLFSDDNGSVNILDLSVDNIQKMVRCFAKINIRLYIDEKNPDIKSSKLSEYCFSLKPNNSDKVYYIVFDFL